MVPVGAGHGERVVRVAFVSDLHLLSSRCDYAHHAISVRNAVQSAEVCVWGGDLFDFCWSCEGDGPASRAIAIDWLERWRVEFPEKTFVYLNGNHDAQTEFQTALQRWAGSEADPPLPPETTARSVPSETSVTRAPASADRLPIRPGATYVGWDAIRLGDCLMVHGDVIEGNGAAVGLARYRSRWQHERTGVPHPPMIRNRLYNAVVSTRLHLATAGVAHRHKNVCMKLMRWIRSQPEWVGEGLQRIIFGHTHRRLGGVRVADYEFFNGGAAVKHVPFEPVVLEVSICRDSCFLPS